MMKIPVINELRTYDLPKHSKSTASVISGLLNFVDDLINKKKSVDPIPVIKKPAIEKPADNPCNDLPTCDVVGQDELRPFQAKIAGSKSLYKSIETVSSTSMLGGNKTRAKVLVCTATDLTGLQTSLTASSRVLQNKS